MNRLIILLTLIILFSCKTEQLTMEDYTLEQDVYLSSNELFEYSLGIGISVEGGFSIKSQAAHFEMSEIAMSKSGQLKQQYIYQSKLDFVGDDVVILQNCISIGGVDCDKIELYRFSFHVK